MELRALGLCGVDESVHPNVLILLAMAYPKIEFGILFRPEYESRPRYPSTKWVDDLCQRRRTQYHCTTKHAQDHNPIVVASTTTATSTTTTTTSTTMMRLAAHLCATRVNEVLLGDDDFVRHFIIEAWHFQRIQINATAVNGVDTSLLQNPDCIENIRTLIMKYPMVEFIIQQNEETKPLWEGLMKKNDTTTTSTTTATTATTTIPLPSNVSFLLDESKGTGVMSNFESWPHPSKCEYKIGYAGGIGPDTIDSVVQHLKRMDSSSNPSEEESRSVWIDMESRLRTITKDNKDIFDISKCYTVIDAVCSAGLMHHPDYLSGGDDNDIDNGDVTAVVVVDDKE